MIERCIEVRSPRGRRWSAIAVGLLAMTATARPADGQAAPDSSPARAVLKVEFRPPSLLPTKANAGDFATYSATQVALIRSPVVIGPALRDAAVARIVAGMPDGWPDRELKVVAVPGTELIQVELTVPGNRKGAVAVVNALVNSYLANVVEAEHRGRVQRLDALRKLWNRYQDELKEKRRTFKQLETVVGTENSTTHEVRRKLANADLEDNRRDLRKVRSERVAAEAVLAVKKAAQGPATDEIKAAREAIEILAIREKELVREQEALIETIAKSATQRIDLETEKAEIDVTTKTANQIGREVEALEVELQAPRRVQLIRAAD